MATGPIPVKPPAWESAPWDVPFDTPPEPPAGAPLLEVFAEWGAFGQPPSSQ
jgi:hypothetical protein